MPLFPDTARRHRQAELMDSPALPPDSHRSALEGLARINAVSRSATVIWTALRQRLGARTDRTIRVLDIACGGGDVAVALGRLARRAGFDLSVDGCDVSATAVRLATIRAAGNPRASFFELDAVGAPLPGGYDAMVSNLFLHHLSGASAVALLRKMASATPTIVVTDLVRGTLGYATAYVGTRVLSRSPVVHVDGPRSVRAAFTIEEARLLAEDAGFADARVDPAFPYRWRLSWSRP